jgi:cystathionine beta-lyase family protein involved in aluminum resistance
MPNTLPNAAPLEALLERFDFSRAVAEAARRALGHVDSGVRAATAALVGANVLHAFAAESIADSDLSGTFGYGYDDLGRARYEALLCRIFGAERALARLSLVSGTHAIVTAIDACLPQGGRLIVATGPPYDTLRNALLDAPHALVAGRAAVYHEVPLERDGVDHAALRDACGRGADVAFVQRSRGYASRPSLSSAACGEIARTVKAVAPDCPVLVDNCYGELVEATEPTHHGVDLVMGSLVKNLGGGLAPGGAYVAGRADLVDRIAARHYAPGLGDALGPTFGFSRAFVQGLFNAPLVVAESLAGLDLAAALFAELGYAVDPAPGSERRDIVQAIRLGTPERLIAFARGLQRAMPLNARFAPEAGPVPGYRDPVVMSSGAFVTGATIELSCDAPLRAPFDVYLQGGTNRLHGLLGALFAADALAKESNSTRP